MSFDLSITFTGMCLFAPEPASTGSTGRMHVLMPAMGQGTDRHYPYLVYDVAYAVEGAKQLSRALHVEGLDEFELLLPGFTRPDGAPIDLSLPEEAYNLDQVFGARRLSREWIRPSPNERLASRVPLVAGCITDYEPGARWRLGFGGPVPMSWKVRWTIRGIEGSELRGVRISRMDGGGYRELPVLRPIRETIHLYVFNAVCKDLPPQTSMQDPELGYAAHHFSGFYSLYYASENLPVPILESKDPPYTGTPPCRGGGASVVERRGPTSVVHEMDSSTHDAHAAFKHGHGTGGESPPERIDPGGRPFTCMVAQGSLE